MAHHANGDSSVTDLIREMLELDAKKGLSLLQYRKLSEAIPFRIMTGIFSAGVDARVDRGDHLYRRVTTGISEDGTELTVIDPVTQEQRTMLNFASNSYFGLGKHPRILRAIADALAIYGTGPAGSPMLNGTTELHTRLEARIARWLGKEAAMLFSSGYLANGWPAVVVRPGDLFAWDERLHASIQEGGMKALQTMRGLTHPDEKVVMHVFPHNDVQRLADMLRRFRKHNAAPEADGTPPRASIWIAVEGVYSMDGDLAPLPEIAKVAEQFGAFVVVDDAHGEGVLGRGKGIEHHFVEPSPTFLTVGTLGKAFASGGGGFIAGPRDVIAYLRVYSPTYLYSTSLSIANTAAALAAFDIIEREPWRVDALHRNVRYLTAGLREIGLDVADRDSGIIGISVPARTDLRKLALAIHNKGIDIATVEPPVVPLNDQHARINVSAAHKKEQLDRFLSVLREFRDELVWTPADKQEARAAATASNGRASRVRQAAGTAHPARRVPLPR
jgi:7-keto-8-aminopelargonate synthetase-like enzyme